MQFLIKSVLPRAPCQFSLFVWSVPASHSLSNFYVPSHSPGWLLIHCLCPSSLGHSLLSPTLAFFLPYCHPSVHWGPDSVPALIAGAGSFPSHRGVINRHHRNSFFIIFVLQHENTESLHGNAVSLLQSTLWVLRSLSTLSSDLKWGFYIFGINRSLFPLWILMLLKRLMILLILVDIHRDGHKHILFRTGKLTSRQKN